MAHRDDGPVLARSPPSCACSHDLRLCHGGRRGLDCDADGWPKTIVIAPQGVVYAERSTSSPVRVTLNHAAMVQVRKADGEWSDVMVMLPGGGGKTIDAFMRSADLLQSAGMAAFWNKQFEPAVSLLDQEVRAHDRRGDRAVAAVLPGLHAVGDGQAGSRARDIRDALPARRRCDRARARFRRTVTRGVGRR